MYYKTALPLLAALAHLTTAQIIPVTTSDGLSIIPAGPSINPVPQPDLLPSTTTIVPPPPVPTISASIAISISISIPDVSPTAPPIISPTTSYPTITLSRTSVFTSLSTTSYLNIESSLYSNTTAATAPLVLPPVTGVPTSVVGPEASSLASHSSGGNATGSPQILPGDAMMTGVSLTKVSVALVGLLGLFMFA